MKKEMKMILTLWSSMKIKMKKIKKKKRISPIDSKDNNKTDLLMRMVVTIEEERLVERLWETYL